MTIEITVNWCEDCSIIEMDQSIDRCKLCLLPFTTIGFVQKEKRLNVGGSTQRRNCKCGKPTVNKGLDQNGKKRYRSQCSGCRVNSWKHRKNICELCGVQPEGKGMIDIDHIDGDRSNNKPENLQSLCKDCHKKKTSEDLKNKVYKQVRKS
jgi:5-methylcytosine-specific restriction endonuclease McrA